MEQLWEEKYKKFLGETEHWKLILSCNDPITLKTVLEKPGNPWIFWNPDIEMIDVLRQVGKGRLWDYTYLVRFPGIEKDILEHPDKDWSYEDLLKYKVTVDRKLFFEEMIYGFLNKVIDESGFALLEDLVWLVSQY